MHWALLLWQQYLNNIWPYYKNPTMWILHFSPIKLCPGFLDGHFLWAHFYIKKYLYLKIQQIATHSYFYNKYTAVISKGQFTPKNLMKHLYFIIFFNQQLRQGQFMRSDHASRLSDFCHTLMIFLCLFRPALEIWSQTLLKIPIMPPYIKEWNCLLLLFFFFYHLELVWNKWST